MNDIDLPVCCIVNYVSKLGIDGNYSYEFWFASSIIRIIADKPFGRGDIVEINSITKQSNTEWRINIKVIGDPKLEKIAMDLTEGEEIPTLLFVTPKIYLNEYSEYHAYSTDNIQIVLNCSAILDGNKSYTIAALVRGKQGKIFASDAVTGNKVEWLVTSSI